VDDTFGGSVLHDMRMCGVVVVTYFRYRGQVLLVCLIAGSVEGQVLLVCLIAGNVEGQVLLVCLIAGNVEGH
jgi:general stress protein CsbA